MKAGWFINQIDDEFVILIKPPSTTVFKFWRSLAPVNAEDEAPAFRPQATAPEQGPPLADAVFVDID
jgi:hypothetical protein